MNHDQRPEVDVQMWAQPPGDPRQKAMVIGSAHCRFGCGNFNSPDIRAVVHWADDHEKSSGHLLAKQEANPLTIASPVDEVPC